MSVRPATLVATVNDAGSEISHLQVGKGRITAAGDRDITSAELSSFNEFMGSHDKIADELSKNPSLANNQEYLENHPALRDYLKTHPEVHEELSENPATFIKSAKQFDPRRPKAAGPSKPK